MLLWLILIPLITALVVPLAPKRQVKFIALIGTLVPLAMVAYLLVGYDWPSPPGDLRVDFPWIPELGISVTLDLDGVGMPLIALTALLGPICVLASFTAIRQRVRTYYGWLLVLQAAMTGVFLARDAILFYAFFEFTLVPMFVLISLYGSTNRKAAAIKFFLFTFTGSIIALAGIVYVAWFHAAKVSPGNWTFNFADLTRTAQSMPAETQWYVFVAMLCGFAVKVPIFPLHTWLPLAHTEAPTAGSVVLAGVLLKLGTYAIYAIAIPFCPAAAVQLAPFMATLCIIGIIAIGLVCWVQTDVKKLVAYSSVSHLGFCMLGMFSFTQLGLQGSLTYMINHGLSTGALFLLIGMMYERYHTRSMHEIGGLAKKMPIWATFMVFFAMASVGLPGLNGFVSEFLCLMGTFQAGDIWGRSAGGVGGVLGPWYAAVAATGMIIAAIYILFLVGKVCFGPLREPHSHGHHAGDSHDDHLPADLTGREILTLIPLAVLCLGLGLYPKPLTSMLEPSVQKTAALIATTRREMEAPTPKPVINQAPLAPGLKEARP